MFLSPSKKPVLGAGVGVDHTHDSKQQQQHQQQPPPDGSTPTASNGSVTAPAEKLKRIGDWIFGETLGQGSFGKVKLAHHAKTKEKVRRRRGGKEVQREKTYNIVQGL